MRVLTHEIMNSMTPVTSLAHSAVELMRNVDQGTSAEVADARIAVETLARRADGVMHFVESYRQISRAPEIRARPIDVAAWGRELEALFRASDRAQGIGFTLAVDETLTLDADPDLMSQVLINLIRNAAQAARARHEAPGRADGEAPHVWLAMSRTRLGRTEIEVADNGAGVPEALRQDIFLPFFTTRQEGTGVGLSLARQVVLAHRGAISVGDRDGGGALFRIVI